MFRGPQLLTWSCPIRSLLLLRESHLSSVAEHTGAGWQGAKHVRYEEINGRSRSKNGSSLSAETVCCSTQLSFFSLDCDKYQLREDSLENLPSKAIFLSHHHNPAKSKQTSDPIDRLVSMTCLQRWRRPWDFFQPLLCYTHKTQCNFLQGNLQNRQYFVRTLSVSSHTSQILSHVHNRPQPLSQSFHQTRALHQAAPRVADTWRDCLSSENENRCRQTLMPNLLFYKERKGASQSSGKNQSRWASILICLCSVEGEPSFLFTLRSSTLKGRHKGDVSFAGGKSDPSDRDVVATALREAQEELGVNVATEKVWGVLSPLRDRSGMLIAPVLANLGPLEELTLKPNPGEVEEIFTLSLSHVCSPHNRGYTHFRIGDKYGYTMPVFRNGKHRVWGLTAVALANTLKVIVPP